MDRVAKEMLDQLAKTPNLNPGHTEVLHEPPQKN